MLFLTSVIFALALYVLPGEWVLWMLAKFITGSGVSAYTLLVAFNGVAYAAIYAGVRFSKIAYEDMLWDQRESHPILKGILQVYGCSWVNVAGLSLLGSGAVVLLLRGSLPIPFQFLFAAIGIGFLDVIAKEEFFPWRQSNKQLRTVLPELTDLIPDAQELASYKCCELTWDYPRPAGTEHYSLSLYLEPSEYQKAKAITRYQIGPLSNFSRYVKEGLQSAVKEIAAWVRQQTIKGDLTPHEEVENCIFMVRSIIYVADKESHDLEDYANFPIETLWLKNGDCEDHAILAAAILHLLGHDVSLLYLNLGQTAHLALGYATDFASGPFSIDFDGKSYAYVETVPTSQDERVGDICDKFLSSLKEAKVIPIS